MDRYPEQRKDVRKNDQQSDSTYEFGGSSQSVVDAAWRGKFNIPGHNVHINVAAHVSKKAGLDVASIMPNVLLLEIIPRIDMWPESFKSSPPDEHNVSLFFLPEERDEEVFHSLVRYAICGDFSLKAFIRESELLIFTSFQLPGKIHRFQGKLYLWGVFKGPVADTNQSEHNLHIQRSFDDERSYDGKEIPVSNCSEHGPLTNTSKARGGGRRLDDAWQHAKQPVDVSRLNAECCYCGFISRYGGISRLKAHLAGGHPKASLTGCKKVFPELKKSMTEWFNEWAKNSKVNWVKGIRGDELERLSQPTNMTAGIRQEVRDEVAGHRQEDAERLARLRQDAERLASLRPEDAERLAVRDFENQRTIQTVIASAIEQAKRDMAGDNGGPLFPDGST